jgi:hypothetical protein
VVAQTLVPRMRAEDQARKDAQTAADEAAYNARVKAVSDKVARPAGLSRDCPEWTDRSLGYFCWLGDGDPVDAAVALRDSLATIASTPPTIRCTQNALYRACQVRAQIDGKFVSALALPPDAGATGVRLDGVVLERQVGDVPLAGRPLAVPR